MWWTLLIEALVKLLIYFFENWWKDSYPYDPAQYRPNFLDTVGSVKYFWMGSDRVKIAAALFDKYQKNYLSNPPIVANFTAPMDAIHATFWAKKFALGLTLTREEVYGVKAKGFR